MGGRKKWRGVSKIHMWVDSSYEDNVLYIHIYVCVCVNVYLFQNLRLFSVVVGFLPKSIICNTLPTSFAFQSVRVHTQNIVK